MLLFLDLMEFCQSSHQDGHDGCYTKTVKYNFKIK